MTAFRLKFFMLAVRVRQHDRVEMVNASPDEKRCDDALADRFGRRAGGERRTAFESTAGVDQDRVTARRLNQQRVGLADVDRRYDEIVRDRAWRPEAKRDRAGEDCGAPQHPAPCGQQYRSGKRDVV